MILMINENALLTKETRVNHDGSVFIYTTRWKSATRYFCYFYNYYLIITTLNNMHYNEAMNGQQQYTFYLHLF